MTGDENQQADAMSAEPNGETPTDSNDQKSISIEDLYSVVENIQSNFTEYMAKQDKRSQDLFKRTARLRDDLKGRTEGEQAQPQSGSSMPSEEMFEQVREYMDYRDAYSRLPSQLREELDEMQASNASYKMLAQTARILMRQDVGAKPTRTSKGSTGSARSAAPSPANTGYPETPEEFLKLMRNDPARADKLMKDPNFDLDRYVRRGG